jgi:hypothetical protein
MENDGGEPGAALVRVYKPFCPVHQARYELGKKARYELDKTLEEE